jgi:hypothetical protein
LGRGPSGRTGPEAPRGPWLGVGLCGLCCPVASSLTTASSAPLGPSRRLICFVRRVFASGARGREGPCFRLRILLVVPLPVPRRAGRPRTIRRPPVVAFARMRGARRPRLPTRIGTPGTRGCPFEAAEFASCCGPTSCLPSFRQGRLRSSFHPMSHLTGTSNMTTRANRQSPAAGLSPAGSAALQAAPHSGQRPGVARRS